jgi:hypothetical protein
MSRLPALLAPLLLMLTCCQPPPAPSPESRADAATLAACRERADAVYNRQNRGTIYAITNRDAPFSGSYIPAPVDGGLSQLYTHENRIRDCVRNTGTETSRAPTPEPAPPTQ